MIRQLKSQERGHAQVVHYVRNLTQNLGCKSVVFGGHVGTRGLWLGALSRPGPPTLILEDDVVLLPGAPSFFRFAVLKMQNDPSILGTSFMSQTLVAATNARQKTVNVSSFFTYPLAGSHGFLLNPDVRDEFLGFVSERKGCELLIDGLRTSLWYADFLKKNLVKERMWTQEMVSFAFWSNRTTLYSPSNRHFAYHCASGHGDDKIGGFCKKALGMSKNSTVRDEMVKFAKTTDFTNVVVKSLNWSAQHYTHWKPFTKPPKPDSRLGCYPPPPPPPPSFYCRVFGRKCHVPGDFD